MFAATVTTTLRRAVGTVVCAVAFVVPLGAAAQDSVAVARLKIAPDPRTRDRSRLARRPARNGRPLIR
jgi:hypothetical protein